MKYIKCILFHFKFEHTIFEEFCIRLLSRSSQICEKYQSSKNESNRKIHILQNDVIRAIIDTNFTDYQLCLSNESVDIQNDQFVLRAASTNDVSFISSYKKTRENHQNLLRYA